MTYKKRKLSQFMGQEMIYDYLSNEIDPVRKKAFEDFIQEDEEFREEVDGVKNSLNYLEALSKTELADHLLSNIELKKSWSQAVSEKLQWGKRSNPLKWAVEAGVVSLIVAAIVIFIPWDKIILKIDSNNFILHEETLDNQQAEEKTKIDQNDVLSHNDYSQSQLEYGHEENPPENLGVHPEPNEESLAKEEKIKDDPDKKQNTVEVKAEKQQPKADESVQSVAKQNINSESSKTKPEADKPTHGYLYRMGLQVARVDDITESVRKKIIELGGRKAGRVRLGWKKSDGSSYFHFILPEKQLDNFALFVRQYGQANLRKLIHPRIMPDGKLRFIMLIKPDHSSVSRDSNISGANNTNQESASDKQEILEDAEEISDEEVKDGQDTPDIENSQEGEGQVEEPIGSELNRPVGSESNRPVGEDIKEEPAETQEN